MVFLSCEGGGFLAGPMILYSTPLSDSLRCSLALCHDDGHPPLLVHSWGGHVEVVRADGSEPSPGEQGEIQTRATAHAIHADETPTVRLRITRDGSELIVTPVE